MTEIKIIGAGAFITPKGEERPRPFERGDLVDVESKVADQLVADGVAADPSAPEVAEREGQVSPLAIETATVEEVAAHIKARKLVNDDTVALAGNDPELAAKVLEADAQVNGGEARAGVKKVLEPIVSPPA
jgi:hypothetical protein